MTDSDADTCRLFFALWPDTAERKALSAWQAPLQALCGGKAMRSDTLHCTLVFLGEVELQRLEALKLAACEVTMRRFDLEFSAARYWGHNHLAYAVPVAVPPALGELVAGLESALHKHHFRFEQREYKPHVTLLRQAQWTDVPLPAMPSVRWRCVDFALVRSLRDARGARYDVLCRFPAQG